jgi:hypothetical protein
MLVLEFSVYAGFYVESKTYGISSLMGVITSSLVHVGFGV